MSDKPRYALGQTVWVEEDTCGGGFRAQRSKITEITMSTGECGREFRYGVEYRQGRFTEHEVFESLKDMRERYMAYEIAQAQFELDRLIAMRMSAVQKMLDYHDPGAPKSEKTIEVGVI